MTLLNTKYEVEPVLPIKNYNGLNIYTYQISHKHNMIGFNRINLDIVLISTQVFRVAFIDFDVNLLSENEHSMSLRIIPMALKYIPDKLTYVRDRILNKTFSYIPTLERSITDLSNIIDKAVQMTHRGWTQDDNLHKFPTWCVGHWDTLIQGKHKKKQTREQLANLITCNNCSLCHEQFKPKDIILNTACNHSYHWKCGNNSTNGLYHWVKLQNTNCPLCRADMFAGF